MMMMIIRQSQCINCIITLLITPSSWSQCSLMSGAHMIITNTGVSLTLSYFQLMLLREHNTRALESPACPYLDYVYENSSHVNILALHEMKIFFLVMGGDKIINDDMFPISKYRHRYKLTWDSDHAQLHVTISVLLSPPQAPTHGHRPGKTETHFIDGLLMLSHMIIPGYRVGM